MLYAIRDMISRIRSLFAEYGGFKQDQNVALLSELNLLKDAEELFANAILDVSTRHASAIAEENTNAKIEERLQNANENNPMRFSANPMFVS